MTFAAIVAGGYLLGSCPWGYWLVRLFHGEDVRGRGSGATGGSNVWRAYGPKLGIAVNAKQATDLAQMLTGGGPGGFGGPGFGPGR